MAEQEKDWFTKLEEKLAKEPPNTPEEMVALATERKAMEGTMWEWAQMQPNKDIAVHLSDHGVGGSRGVDSFTISPTEEGYEQCRKQYCLDKPGDTRHIVKKLIEGNWVVQGDEKTEGAPIKTGKE